MNSTTLKNKTSVSKALIIAFIMTSLLIVFGFYAYKKNKENEQVNLRLLMESKNHISESMKVLKDSYEIRNQLVVKLFTEFKESKALEKVQPQIKFMSVNPLKTEVDLRQFDQVQNEISNTVATFLAKKIKNGKIDPQFTKWYQEIERSEKKIIDSRADLTKFTLEYNDLRLSSSKKHQKQFEMQPLFVVEQQLHDESLKSQNTSTTEK